MNKPLTTKQINAKCPLAKARENKNYRMTKRRQATYQYGKTELATMSHRERQLRGQSVKTQAEKALSLKNMRAMRWSETMDLSREVEAYGLVEIGDRGQPILTFHKKGNKASKTLKMLEAKLGYSLINEYHNVDNHKGSNVFEYIKTKLNALLEQDKVDNIDKTINKIVLGNLNTILINTYKDYNLYPVYNKKENLTGFRGAKHV